MRAAGIEPASQAWEAHILPMYYARSGRIARPVSIKFILHAQVNKIQFPPEVLPERYAMAILTPLLRFDSGSSVSRVRGSVTVIEIARAFPGQSVQSGCANSTYLAQKTRRHSIGSSMSF